MESPLMIDEEFTLPEAAEYQSWTFEMFTSPDSSVASGSIYMGKRTKFEQIMQNHDIPVVTTRDALVDTFERFKPDAVVAIMKPVSLGFPTRPYMMTYPYDHFERVAHRRLPYPPEPIEPEPIEPEPSKDLIDQILERGPGRTGGG